MYCNDTGGVGFELTKGNTDRSTTGGTVKKKKVTVCPMVGEKRKTVHIREFEGSPALTFYSAKQNTPQLAAWVTSMWQNLTQRGNFRNAPSACGGDRKFQGFASLLIYG